MVAYLDIQQGSTDEVQRLRKIVTALMNQVERTMDVQGGAFSLFQTAILLDDKVRGRTGELEAAMKRLEETNDELNSANAEAHTARLRLVEAVESVSEGFALFDETDSLILCNSKFREYWGMDENDIPYGSSFQVLSQGLIDNCRVPLALQDRQQWLEDRFQRHKNPDGAFVMRMFDGRWLKVTERRTGDGGVVGIYTDITEIKKQEELRRQKELAEKSVLLQASIDNLSQGVAVYSSELKLVAWNQRFVDLLELPDGLVRLGMPFQEYLQFNANREEYATDMERSVRERLEQATASSSFFFEYVRPTGRVLEVRRNPMPNGGFVTTYTDITARRQAAVQLSEAKEHLEERVRERTAALSTLNEQLRQEIAERLDVEEELRLATKAAEEANLSKTRFLAAASHDLLQPLNAARLFISTLQEQRLAEKTERLVERTDLALQGVENLLSTLLEISKLDAGAVPTKLRDFPISDVLKRLTEEYQPVISDAGLELRMIDSSVTVNSDRKLLERILRNFLSNAVRYTYNGKILIGCRRRKGKLLVQVSDTGLGIGDKDLDTIFDEFHQLKQSGDNGAPGVGLGLAIVKRIAGMLDVPVIVDSRLGRGSTFAVEIPISNRKIQSSPPSRRLVPSLEMPLHGASVLVIDNEASIREGMYHLLTSWGCDVFTAADLDEVRRLVESGNLQPDFLIVDYHLDNRITGVDILLYLEREYDIRAPSIVVTADRSDEMRHQVTKAGYRVLHKPLKPHRLRAWMAHSMKSQECNSQG
ncbi:NahK/ErcS family hybrid sensor histidine kinase/response regulator [Sedimenticola hydrogenitrophicus]|uniref:NahK/ErcS family hybrid sensor histidine kinase/response regulator n=1 Tax=Sedimenticola hydrogenitrophicus TaxID=2967975 RepID=UPI0023AEA1FA|nr:NahK/ErcS family hybrid sensor histidine kinase/response regulator [Sedimenticola hydrogenitrophicus]